MTTAWIPCNVWRNLLVALPSHIGIVARSPGGLLCSHELGDVALVAMQSNTLYLEALDDVPSCTHFPPSSFSGLAQCDSDTLNPPLNSPLLQILPCFCPQLFVHAFWAVLRHVRGPFLVVMRLRYAQQVSIIFRSGEFPGQMRRWTYRGCWWGGRGGHRNSGGSG